MPDAQLEFGFGRLKRSRSDTVPNAVAAPVCTTTARALPLTTGVPIKSTLVRPLSAVSRACTPLLFCTA